MHIFFFFFWDNGRIRNTGSGVEHIKKDVLEFKSLLALMFFRYLLYMMGVEEFEFRTSIITLRKRENGKELKFNSYSVRSSRMASTMNRRFQIWSNLKFFAVLFHFQGFLANAKLDWLLQFSCYLIYFQNFFLC